MYVIICVLERRVTCQVLSSRHVAWFLVLYAGKALHVVAMSRAASSPLFVESGLDFVLLIFLCSVEVSEVSF